MAEQNVWTPEKLETARKQLDELYRRHPMRGTPPLAGVEATVGCLKCRKPFGMRLGAIEPVQHQNGTVGFLCRGCVEELNRWRAFLKLPALPLNVAGYFDPRWEAQPGLIICGDAVLSMRGWELLDAVALSEFASLPAERAVAFDAAQVLPREEYERLLAPVVVEKVTPRMEAPVNPELRRQLGDSLREEFKHRPRDGQICAKCGAADRPLATHVAVFLEGNPGLDPRAWAAQGTSYAPARGGPAVCDRCAPPCKRCQLPVVEGATARWLKGLPGLGPANGRCTEHFRIFGLTF